MPRMLHSHFTLLAVLLGFTLPLYALDHYLLKPSGGFLPIDFRGLLVKGYLLWLVVHALLSSAALLLLKHKPLLLAHGISALLAVVLLITGFKAYDHLAHQKQQEARAEMLEQRKALVDIITLKQWRYLPDATNPEAIEAVVMVSKPGRFAAHVTARSGDTADVQIFSGELKPQLELKEAQTLTLTLPLTFYGAMTDTAEYSFALSLFARKQGPSPQDVFKYYVSTPPAVADDGHAFYAPLMPRH